MYYMCQSYSSYKQLLPTNDLVEAIKISLNYESDLYRGNKLLASWLGYSMDTNIENLEKEGIECYIAGGQYKFRYKDSKKNIKRIYFKLIEYKYKGKQVPELHLSDTPSKRSQPYYDSLEQVLATVKEQSPHISEVTVVDFSKDEFTGSYQMMLN